MTSTMSAGGDYDETGLEAAMEGLTLDAAPCVVSLPLLIPFLMRPYAVLFCRTCQENSQMILPVLR